MKVCMALFVCVAVLTAWFFTADAKELFITTIKDEPYVMSKGSELEGYCIDLISELSKKLGFKYNLHLVKDNRYGAMDSSGNWNGMIGEVIRGEADLAVAPLTATAVRERFVDMTTPFIQTGLSFIVHKATDSEDSMFSLLAPFSTDMWIGIIIAFLLTGFCIFLVGRLMDQQQHKQEGSEDRLGNILCKLLPDNQFYFIQGCMTTSGH